MIILPDCPTTFEELTQHHFRNSVLYMKERGLEYEWEGFITI